MEIKVYKTKTLKKPKNIGKIIKTRKFNNYLIESLKDPKEVSAYLNVVLEEYKKDNNAEAFLLASRDVAEARGGLSRLAQKTKLTRQNLYRTLSSESNPQLITLGNVLNGLGFHFSIKPIEKRSVAANRF